MKKQFTTITIILFLISSVSFAQDLTSAKTKEDSLRIGWWDKNAQFGVNFTGANFNSNWQGGGSNNLGLGLFFNGFAQKTKGKNIWTNTIQMQYAMVKNQGLSQARKSNDRIFADTKYGRVINPKLNYFIGANFFSQFAKGYDYNRDVNGVALNKGGDAAKAGYYTSKFFAPAYVNIATGIEWVPVPYFTVSFGPIAYKGTFVGSNDVLPLEYKNKQPRYGVLYGKKSLNEFGGQLVTNFNKEVVKNVTINWRQQFFQAYTGHKRLDYRSDLLLTAKVNDYINLTGTWIAIYDEDMIPVDQRAGAKNLWQSSLGFNIGFLVNL